MKKLPRKKRTESTEKKEKKLKLPFPRILGNNLFILKMIHRVAPGYIAFRLVLQVCWALVSFVSSSYLLRYAINGIGEGKAFSEIVWFAVAFFVVQIVLSLINVLFWEWYAPPRQLRITGSAYETVFRQALRVDLACYENPSYYEKMSRAISECGNRAFDVLNALCSLVYVITSFSANFALIVAIDPVLLLFTLIPLCMAPVKAKINKLIYQKNFDIQEEKRQRDYTRRAFFLGEYAKEMRLTDMPSLLLSNYQSATLSVIRVMRRYGFRTAARQYLVSVCNEVVTELGATMYAVWQTLGTGNMGYGDCVVAVNAISTVAYTLTNTSERLLKFQENALYIENLREFLNTEPTIRGGETPLPDTGDLVLQSVSFRYEGAQNYALKDVSMRFGARETVAIVGHNGAGKTTLVKLLLRLYDPEGTITYNGTDIRELQLQPYREAFSSVMQDYHIFAVSAAENVLLRPRGEGDEALVHEALDKSGLRQKTDGFPQGIDTMMTREFDKNGEQLSGGEGQKMAIAHVYTKKNRFVILDEPSSALDPIAEHEMYERMREACADCGMIFISHRLSSAVSADRIYLMENGSVAETGSHAELMERNGRYAEMFRRQAENYGEAQS